MEPERRILDLSRAAADRLGLRRRGVGRVRVVVSEAALQVQSVPAKVSYEVQLGAFRESPQAHALWDRLRGRSPAAYVAARDGPLGRYSRVRLGPFETQADAQQHAQALAQMGYAVFVDEVADRTIRAQRFRLAGEVYPAAREAVGGDAALLPDTITTTLSQRCAGRFESFYAASAVAGAWGGGGP